MDPSLRQHPSKNLIIEEAIQQLQYSGYHGLTLVKLAQKLNISPTTIDKYYKDEKALLKEIVQREAALSKLQFIQIQKKTTHNLLLFAQEVENVTWALIENGGFTPCTISLLLREKGAIPEDTKNIIMSYVEWTSDFFYKQATNAISHKGLSPDPETCAALSQQLLASVRDFLENVNTCTPIQSAKQKYKGTLSYNYKTIESNIKSKQQATEL